MYQIEKKIEQLDFGVVEFPNIISTEGLGPCIGIVVAWKHTGLIYHATDPYMEAETTEEFLSECKRRIPIPDRHKVLTILCGSLIDSSDDSKTTRRARKFIYTELIKAGFTAPIQKWNSIQKSGHKIVINLGENNVTLYRQVECDEEIDRWAISPAH